MSLSADRPMRDRVPRPASGCSSAGGARPEFECQPRTIGVAEVDGPLVADFD